MDCTSRRGAKLAWLWPCRGLAGRAETRDAARSSDETGFPAERGRSRSQGHRARLGRRVRRHHRSDLPHQAGAEGEGLSRLAVPRFRQRHRSHSRSGAARTGCHDAPPLRFRRDALLSRLWFDRKKAGPDGRRAEHVAAAAQVRRRDVRAGGRVRRRTGKGGSLTQAVSRRSRRNWRAMAHRQRPGRALAAGAVSRALFARSAAGSRRRRRHAGNGGKLGRNFRRSMRRCAPRWTTPSSNMRRGPARMAW